MKVNIKYSCFVFVCCLFYMCLNAQVHKKYAVSHISTNQLYKNKFDFVAYRHRMDSLLHLLKSTPDNTSKVILYTEISNLLLSLPDTSNGLNQAASFASKALVLSDKLNDKYYSAQSLLLIGSIYERRKNFETAIAYYKQALNKIDFIKKYSLRDHFFSYLLNADFYIGDYTNAMEVMSNELKIAEEIKDKKYIAICNNLLGYIFLKEGSYGESGKCYQLYISYAKETKDTLSLIHALGETSDLYIQLKDSLKALSLLNEAVQSCNNMLAIDSSKTYIKQLKDKLMYRCSLAYQINNNLPQALRYGLVAIDGSKINGANLYDEALYYINAGKIYSELVKYKKAIKYLKYGFQLSNQIGHREDIRDAAEQLSQLYASEKNYDSAFFYYKLFTGLKDSIINDKVKIKIAEIQEQYNVVKKNEEINKERKQRNFIIAGFIILLFSLLIIYYINSQKQKIKLQQEKYNQQQELFKAVIITQDKERKRIAEDIHDRIGTLLSAARMNLPSIDENKTAKGLLDEASVELRNIAHNLMPATLSKLGLIAAIKNLIGNISSSSNLKIIFSSHGFDKRLDETTEMNIYQIILESLNNIIKHARANLVTVQLIEYDNYLNIMIEDDGRGFDYTKQMKQKKGIGLANIFSRVESLNGTINIDSEENEGTTISVEIPKKI